MTALPEIDPADHIEILDQVVQGCQLPAIAIRTGVPLEIVRGYAAEAGAPDLGEVRGHLQRLEAAQPKEPAR